jgi:ribonuclease HI
VAKPEDNLGEFQARLVELRQQLPPPDGPGPYAAYTDGACIGNPGRGGWGTYISAGAPEWDLWGHLAATTNNRAEALGVLAALEWLPSRAVLTLYSDSRITVGILTGTMKARANVDLWQEINRVRSAKAPFLSVEWVPAHVGISGNERADYLSRLGASNGDVGGAQALARPAPASSDVLAGLVAHDDWERNFLKSIANQLRSGRSLSAKQQTIVDRIRARS